VPCIGIGSWGYTAGKEQLDNTPDAVEINNSSSTSKGTRSFGRSNNQTQVIQAIRMVSSLGKYF